MDPLLVGVYIVVAMLLITGPAGSLLPFLPGTPLIPAAALLHTLMTDFSPIGAGRLLMLAGLAALPTFWSMSRVPSGRKKVGGSAGAVIGAGRMAVEEPREAVGRFGLTELQRPRGVYSSRGRGVCTITLFGGVISVFSGITLRHSCAASSRPSP